ncbi:MAG: MASE1 domain-containing protein [Rhodospirillales bacterium]|nr:MASE1 domain-containing protein [Rhodospirillales bacterium]
MESTLHRFDPRPPGVSWPRFATEGLAYVVIYVALDWISFIDDLRPIGITPWNPPPGLSLALLICRGLGYTVWLPVAAIVADVAVRDLPSDFAETLAVAAVITAGYGGAAIALRDWLKFDDSLRHIRDVALLLWVSAVAAFVVAILYAGVFVGVGLLHQSGYLAAAFRFWVGDLIGIVVFVPLLLRFGRRPIVELAASGLRRLDIEAVLQLTSIALMLWLVFGLELSDAFKSFYLLLLPVVWVAARHGIDGAAVAVALTQIGTIVALQWHSFAGATVTEVQLLMLSVAITGLLIGAIVSDRQETQRALDESEARLRERQAELDRFARTSIADEIASALAHEMRQPLTAVTTYIGGCQSLLEAGADRAEIATAIDKAAAQARRANQVLARLRDFLYRGEVDLDPVPMTTLVEEVRSLLQTAATEGRVKLVVRPMNGLPPVMADKTQIEQVILNLGRNAVEAIAEASSPRRRIEINARAAPPFVELSVADTGPGIPADIRPRLFHPFTTSKSKGMGLGLTISRSIVEAHGGRLWAEDRPGGGTVFRLTLLQAGHHGI